MESICTFTAFCPIKLAEPQVVTNFTEGNDYEQRHQSSTQSLEKTAGNGDHASAPNARRPGQHSARRKHVVRDFLKFTPEALRRRDILIETGATIWLASVFV